MEQFAELGYEFIEKEIFRYTFAGDKPKVVTKLTVDGERTFVENAETIKIGDSYQATIRFAIDTDEAIYGLGRPKRNL